MVKQTQNPDYVYEGFANVYMPTLAEPEVKSKLEEYKEKLEAQKKAQINKSQTPLFEKENNGMGQAVDMSDEENNDVLQDFSINYDDDN